MLSKNDEDLLYACVAVVCERLSFLLSLFTVAGVGAPLAPSVVLSAVSSVGEPDAKASLIMSSLLNLAFANSKS